MSSTLLPVFYDEEFYDPVDVPDYYTTFNANHPSPTNPGAVRLAHAVRHRAVRAGARRGPDRHRRRAAAAGRGHPGYAGVAYSGDAGDGRG